MTTTVLAYIPSPPRGVWHIGIIPIRAYALLIIAGIVVALLIGDRRWRARGGEPGVIYDIMLWAVPFGLIGGRLYHVLTDWKTYFGDGGAGLIAALRIMDGGLGIWGAVALGGVGAWIGCRRAGIPLPAFGDAIAPGIVLAQAIGRIGNYFNQELYGRATTLPWGLQIFERKNASGAEDSLNGVSTGQLKYVVHPTFLYELIWNVLIFVFLIWADRKFKLGHGRLFALYVAGYCVGRFCIELMRSDTATQLAGIRINSFIATFVFIGAVVYIMVAPKGREDPSTLRGKHAAAVGEEGKVEELAKELAMVAAGGGVVAAAEVAGEAEDEDAKAVGDIPDRATEGGGPEGGGPEALVADIDEAHSEEIAEAQASAAADEGSAEDAGPGQEPSEADESAEEISEAAAEAEPTREEPAEVEVDSSEEPEPEAAAPEVEDQANETSPEAAIEGAVAGEPAEGPEEPVTAEAEADEQPGESPSEEAESAVDVDESVEVETERADETEAESEPQEPVSEAAGEEIAAVESEPPEEREPEPQGEADAGEQSGESSLEEVSDEGQQAAVTEEPVEASGSEESAAAEVPGDADESTDVEAEPGSEETDQVEPSDEPEPDADVEEQGSRTDQDAVAVGSTPAEVTDDSEQPETRTGETQASGRRRWWQRRRR